MILLHIRIIANEWQKIPWTLTLYKKKQCHYIIISNIKRKIKTKWSIFIFLFFLITVTIQQDASSFYYWFLLEIIEQRAQWKDAVLTKVCNSIANGKRQVDLWFWLTSLVSLPTKFEATERFNVETKTKQFSLSATHSSTNI